MKLAGARVPAVGAVLILILAACGRASQSAPPSGPAAGSDPPTSGVASGEPATDTIKIGLIAPLSGKASAFGKAQHMIESIYRNVNESGGINGRQLELVIEDDECDPTTTNLALTKLIEDDQVFMIHGGICSNALIAGLPTIEESGIPFLVNSAASGATTDPPLRNLFHPGLTQPAITAAIGPFVEEAAASLGNRVAIVSQHDEWGLGWLDAFKASIEGTDIKLVAEEDIGIEAGDATAQVQRVIAAEPDIAIVFAYPQPFSAFLRDAHAQGLNVPVITGNTVQPEEQLGRAGDRDAVMTMFGAYAYKHPVSSPEYDEYRDLLAEYYPQDEFDSNALLAITGALANIEVLERMGDDLTWENWITTMEGLENFETPVNVSPVTFAAYNPNEPSTRRGGTIVAFSHLDPAAAEGNELVVVQSWEEWEALQP
jgi:branched-chain amino acid transport system substrate-binding protein